MKYIVLANRRAKNTISSEKENEEIVVLTDASILMHCRKIAEQYINNKRFPEIIIVTDIISSGFELNQLLDNIESEIIKNFIIENSRDKERILSDLLNSISIEAEYIADTTTLLHGRYAHKIRKINRVESNTWRKNIRTAEYLLELETSKEDFDKVKSELKEIRKGNYIKTWKIGACSAIKAELTLQFIESNEKYKIIPFTFIVDLDSEETQQLESLFVNKIKDKDLKNLLEHYKSFKNMRVYNEFLTTLINLSIVKDFCEQFKINYTINDVKIIENFNFYTSRQTRNCINSILKKQLMKITELQNELGVLIYESKIVESKKAVENSIETYIYNKRYEENRLVHELRNRAYNPYVDYSRRYVISMNEMLSKFSTEQLLEMVNTGYITISSYGNNKESTDGLRQFIRAEIKADEILPLKYKKYIPLLSYMQDECKKWHIDLKSELEDFCEWGKERIEASAEELFSFVYKLYKLGQKVGDFEYISDSKDDELKKLYKEYLRKR